jgi:hypothetical protein
MNHASAAAAIFALSAGGLLVGATTAAAQVPAENGRVSVAPRDPSAPSYPEYDPAYEVRPIQSSDDPGRSDDTAAMVVQSGGSALAGAGLAVAGCWLYWRRRPASR